MRRKRRATTGAHGFNEGDSDRRGCLRRQVQEARLRERQPFERAEIDRAQDSFAGLAHRGSRQVEHAMREKRNRTIVPGIGRIRRVRGVGPVRMMSARMLLRLRRVVQPRVQLRAHARHAQKQHYGGVEARQCPPQGEEQRGMPAGAYRGFRRTLYQSCQYANGPRLFHKESLALF